MISENDLMQAIAECKSEHNPNANTCYKLAAYYIILNEMKKENSDISGYSFSDFPGNTIAYNSGSDFAKAIQGKNVDEVFPIFEELMQALQILNPKIYSGVMRKLRQIDT